MATPSLNPHRPFSPAEQERREKLAAYLGRASEDALIEEVLLPLFRQLGYARITPAGHKDKALEYGKDIWMYYTLPTQHRLYFGNQISEADLASLVLNRRYELLLSSFGTMASPLLEAQRVVRDLVQLELDERVKDLDAAITTLVVRAGPGCRGELH